MDYAKLQSLMKDKKQAMKRVERAVKLNPGKNRIRVLPGWRAGEEHVWYHDFGTHFIKDGAGQIQAIYICTQATFGKPCEICDAIVQGSRSTIDDATQKIIADAKAGKVILINALMLDSDQPNTPVVLELKPSVFGQLMQTIELNGPEVMFDLEKGHEVVISRDGKGLGTTYTAQMSLKPTPIPTAVLSRLNNLDEYVAQESEEQKRRALLAVNAVAGILPAPSRPATSVLPAAAAVGRIGPPVEFEDVPDFPVRAAKPAETISAFKPIEIGDDIEDFLSDIK